MGKKIVYVSDLDMKSSGYSSLSSYLCKGLHEKGHQVIVAGLSYDGSEHNLPVPIVPAENFMDVFAITQNLLNMGQCEVLIVALDLTVQEQIIQRIRNKNFKYMGIFPIEADPLCTSLAMCMMQMDKQFVISQFGTEECHKKGVMTAEHLQLGVNMDMWTPATPEEKVKIRKKLGIAEDEFVVFTVADNQERKNLWAAVDGFARFHKEVPKSRWILVTREFSAVGWRIREMAQTFGVQKNIMIFERGIAAPELRALYGSADAFMLTSKAEGLGLPLLEAMAMKVPCVATDCTGMHELLSDDRGLLVEPEYQYIDPFANGNRYLIDRARLSYMLMYIHDHPMEAYTERAYEYVSKRSWDIPVEQLDKELDKYEQV